ncbi:MAG: substrate-binding domain-containing protein [Verrucomicrobia bacterium]|nr:substrate-binding domain-containing protein [Verrucomicrobiota bacterium]
MSKALNFVLGVALIIIATLYFSTDRGGKVRDTFEPRPDSKSGSEEEYVLVAVSVGNAYWIDARDGFEDAAADLGVRATFTGPQGSDASKQVDIIETALARGVDGLIVVPAEPEAVKPAIDRAIAAGVPVITQDTDSPGSDRYTFIGTGNYEAGKLGGELLAEAVGYKGEVGLLTIPGQWNLEERLRGYEDALKDYEDIEVVAVGNDRAEEGRAAAEAQSMLQAHPDIAGFGCVDAAGGVGAAVAVRDAGKKGEIKIIAMDRNEATLDFIERGFIQSSLAQRSYTMSYLGLHLLHMLNHDKIKMVSDWEAAGVCPLPTSINTGVVVIDTNNVEYFRH